MSTWTSPPPDEMDDDMKDKYLLFRLGDEDYGLEIRHVKEIVNIQRITEVPDMPRYVKGVVNLRGQVIPLVDLRIRFHLSERPYDERTCIIVVHLRDDRLLVGLVVDTVDEVREIGPTDIVPPPQDLVGQSAPFVRGLGKVGDSVKIILDVNKLLFENDLLPGNS